MSYQTMSQICHTHSMKSQLLSFAIGCAPNILFELDGLTLAGLSKNFCSHDATQSLLSMAAQMQRALSGKALFSLILPPYSGVGTRVNTTPAKR
ncbi:hypothetical protein [Chromobacterium subtsugae]|uniref:hypothetical protein n=2 Tax=Chromobacterium subtsugae TaxID=251747 RepID=UPI00155DD812|nr:hypothetical protein [Chromobacterium subtsugae]